MYGWSADGGEKNIEPEGCARQSGAFHIRWSRIGEMFPDDGGGLNQKEKQVLRCAEYIRGEERFVASE